MWAAWVLLLWWADYCGCLADVAGIQSLPFAEAAVSLGYKVAGCEALWVL